MALHGRYPGVKAPYSRRGIVPRVFFLLHKDTDMPLPRDFKISDKIMVQYRPDTDSSWQDVAEFDSINQARAFVETNGRDGLYRMGRYSPPIRVGVVTQRVASMETNHPEIDSPVGVNPVGANVDVEA
jgi:hypothetical protein